MSSPSFKGLQPSSEAASYSKRQNRSAHSRPELALRKALTQLGLRYRLHANDLAGKPDIVFRRYGVVVFCDGDFWHGRNWRERRKKLKKGANAEYWIAKIQANITRDRKRTDALRREGWIVIRVWETDISAEPEQSARYIAKILALRNSSSASRLKRKKKSWVAPP